MKKVVVLSAVMLTLGGCQQELLQEEVKEAVEVIERKEITTNITNGELYTANNYFTDFVHSGIGSFGKEGPSQEELFDLGFWLYVTKGFEGVEVKEVNGIEYWAYNYDDFNKTINEYIDVTMEKSGNDLWLFDENTFYRPFMETGFMISEFVQTERVFDNGDGTFLVELSIYEYDPVEDDHSFEQYTQPKSTWTASMNPNLIGTATLTMNQSEDLGHYVICDYQVENFKYYEDADDWLDEPTMEESYEEDDNYSSVKADGFYDDYDPSIVVSNFEEAIEIAKAYYGEGDDGDTLYSADEEDYDEYGNKYYLIRLYSKSLSEMGGTGFLFPVKVYEDGTINEEF